MDMWYKTICKQQWRLFPAHNDCNNSERGGGGGGILNCIVLCGTKSGYPSLAICSVNPPSSIFNFCSEVQSHCDM